MAKRRNSGGANFGTFFVIGIGAFLLIKNKSASASTPAQQALSVALPRSPVSGSGSSYNIWVQESLNKIQGANLVLDGIIGPMTRQEIMKFQQTWGIAVDGIVGPETDYYLRSAQGIAGYTDVPYQYTAQDTWW